MTNEQTTAGGLNPGEKIGKYEIRERLGAGGQSIVYKGYDALLDRYVAIKQVAPHLTVNELYMTKLRENLRKIARLGQQNEAIVTIHDVLEDARGMFYVMEFVEGHTLETRLAEAGGPIEAKAALLILFRLAAALHDVHGEGIVHRDMKPSNIILTEGLKPKIIDFGVAAFGNEDASMPLATTKYLAPELYSRPDADARADLYSLGFITYEMLLGRPKFNEIFEDVVRDPHSAALRWMKWHGNEAVAAPPLHEVNPAIPRPLSDIVARLIEKDPIKRYPSAEELGKAIKLHFSARFRRTPAGELHPVGEEDFHLPAAELPPVSRQQQGYPSVSEPIPSSGGSERDAADPEGPTTAPLPKEPLSPARRMTIIAAVVLVFLGLIGAGVAWLLHVREEGRQRALSAARLFQDGTDLYDQGNYEAALEKFQDLHKRQPSTTRSARADVLAAMCRAQIAIAQRRFSEAHQAEQQAENAAEALQKNSDDKELVEWTRQILQDIERIGHNRLSTNIFQDAMDEAQARLDKAGNLQDFDDILRDFNRQLGASGVGLTPAQETSVTDMQLQIARRKFLFLVDRHIREGDALLAKKEYDAAQAAYLQAEDRVRDVTATQTIPPTKRDSLLRLLEEKNRILAARRGADRTYQAIRDAERAENPAALKKALNEALKLSSLTDEDRNIYRTRLRTIEADEGVAAAALLFEEKLYDKALAALQNVKKLQPNHLGAKTLQAKIEKAKQRDQAVQAGDQAFQGKKYDEALKQYRLAEKLQSDDAVKNKIRDVEFQRRLQTASALVKESKYNEAEVAYAEAKRIKPSESANVEGLILIMRERKKYGEYLAEGDAALEQKQWRKAIQAYQLAKQQTRDTREVEDRIHETNYQKFLQAGKKALAEENLPVARWNFKQAKQNKDTREVRDLLNQAGEKESEK
ncbi:MAG: protein kinase [Phycisphaerae bacterium]|nr:protein kinase [Phycisphaerae bacterium]